MSRQPVHHGHGKPREALIALGSNLAGPFGAPQAAIRRAIGEIAQTLGRGGRSQGGARSSSLWRSPAWPEGSGPDYVNAAVAIPGVTLGADEILALLHGIEARAGRVREARWGPRTLDLDLLALGETVAPDAETQRRWREAPDPAALPAPERAILPHPRLQDRAFVLAPLAEIAPAWCHPLTGLHPARMLAARPEAERRGVARIA